MLPPRRPSLAAALAILALLLAGPAALGDSVPQKEALETVEQLAPTVEEVAQTLWDLAEVSLLEVKSSAYLKKLLKDNGFTITSEATRRAIRNAGTVTLARDLE